MSLTDVGIIMLVSAVGGFVRGVTGMGQNIVAVPLIAIVLNPRDAIVVLVLASLLLSIVQMWMYRKYPGDVVQLYRLITLAVVGGIIGSVLLKTIAANVFTVAIGVLLILYVAIRIRWSQLRVPIELARVLGPCLAFSAGMFQGSLGIGGPLLAPYLHGTGMIRRTFMFSMAVVFGAVYAIQALAMWKLGMFNRDLVVVGITLFIPLALSFYVGTIVGNRVPVATFNRWLLIVFTIMGCQLMLHGFGLVG